MSAFASQFSDSARRTPHGLLALASHLLYGCVERSTTSRLFRPATRKYRFSGSADLLPLHVRKEDLPLDLDTVRERSQVFLGSFKSGHEIMRQKSQVQFPQYGQYHNVSGSVFF